MGRGHQGAVDRVAYVPGGDSLASAGADGSAHLWWIGEERDAQPDLFGYLERGFFAFDPDTQATRWAGGSGFLGVPAASLAGLWQNADGAKVADYLLARGHSEPTLVQKARLLTTGLGQTTKNTMKMLESEDNETVLKDLGTAKMLRCRIRYFTDGAVIGSKEFVNEAFVSARDRFGPKRKDGARRLKGHGASSGGTLWSLRDLRKGIGSSGYL